MVAASSLWAGTAVAGNGAVSTVVAYANLLDPQLVREIERRLGDAVRDDLQVALAIVDRYLAESTVHPSVARAMADASRAGDEATADAALVTLWILDVVTSDEPLADVLSSEGVLRPGDPFDLDPVLGSARTRVSRVLDRIRREVPGLVVPRSATGRVDANLVRTAVTITLTGSAGVWPLFDRYAGPAHLLDVTPPR